MTTNTEKRFDTVAEIMKRHDPKETQNIMDSISAMKRLEPQDELEINAHFDELCKKHGYDLADFTTAKII